MDITTGYSILILAFGLGMLHALDADHVMAVTGLAAQRPGLRQSLRFCSRWAIGHGLALLFIGGAVLLLGMAIPATLSAIAESLVGLVLIAIGLWVIVDLYRRRAHLHFHHHDDLPRHAHWHTHHPVKDHARDSHQHTHRAVMVGLLHGTAGSAPLLALLPLTAMGESPWLGMAYLLLFGLGVLLAMFIFGGMLGSVFNWMMRWGNRTVRIMRGGVAISAMGFGAYLLAGSLRGMLA